jgi:hydrogenase maturation protein HypF
MKKDSCQRLRITVRGAVQGVGFRPFVYRLAKELNLTGWVNNSSQGVFIEVEGLQDKLNSFLFRIEREKPPRSFIQSLESSFLDAVGFAQFEIRHSDEEGAKTALVLPDVATCDDCLREIFDPQNRRYLYPFTNCTNCGPRFSIIEALPYDRRHTTMKTFIMCDECQTEYDNPLDRRFHAQPNACSVCGPHLEFWDNKGTSLFKNHQALLAATEAIIEGKVVAVKGLGGFHLIVDARNGAAVQSLRRRKHREEKPFALMFPSIESIETFCEVSKHEQRLLLSPESPIVLLKRKSETQNSKIAFSVAPDNPYFGAMLPYTPLHHLLMSELGFPIVATSGNLSDEPICTDEKEALERMNNIADVFLIHNRPIARHVDDSIARVMAGREMLMRRARGYAPLPIHISQSIPPALSVGAHLKNTIATTVGNDIFISQHIGDLETATAYNAFTNVIEKFRELYELKPKVIACDLHPSYISTQFAKETNLPTVSVQHHYAHVLSCMAENELKAPLLGVAWDGTGYGLDGTIWGSEFLLVDKKSFKRTAHLRTFHLPGGEKAVKEPCRAALGLLNEIFGEDVFNMDDCFSIRTFTQQKRQLLQTMLSKNLNSPVTSSMGRLFDAVASIIGLRQTVRFEGQAAMELEFTLEGFQTDSRYGIDFRKEEDSMVIDWQPMILEILSDIKSGVAIPEISAKFHNTLVESIIAVAFHNGEEKIVLTGGCFQNRYLTERAIQRLREEGFSPYWHQRVPPNDGGIALGQALAVARELTED